MPADQSTPAVSDDPVEAVALALFHSDLWFSFTSPDGPRGPVTDARYKAAQIAVAAVRPIFDAEHAAFLTEVAEAFGTLASDDTARPGQRTPGAWNMSERDLGQVYDDAARACNGGASEWSAYHAGKCCREAGVAAVVAVVQTEAYKQGRADAAAAILAHREHHAPMPESGVPPLRRRVLTAVAQIANPITEEEAAQAVTAFIAEGKLP